LLFGGVAACREEDWGKVTSLRVFYQGGLEVEYGFALPGWAGVPVDPGTSRVVSGGMKVLYDPQAILGTLQREVLLGGGKDAGRGPISGRTLLSLAVRLRRPC
jgi:hypothetical protein